MGRQSNCSIRIKAFSFAILFLIFLSSCALQKNSDVSSLNTETVTSTSKIVTSDTKRVTNTTGDASNNIEIKFSTGSFNENDIQQLFELTKEEVEKYLGTNYLLEFTGAEAGEMYRYADHDVSIEYGLNNSIHYIDCGEQVSLYGTNSGMLFDEIKSILGETKIQVWSPEEDDEMVFYSITAGWKR